ncbi:erythromycin esterase family protein [Actinomycetospora sp. NBRC 106375]|uniref:erythromycin esterase family protein n=1 Tax=Actinomycetospora sp. NBRC 106375 TaxID=3032207 RepID=UPI002557C01A|nr:erythromycin esterase family protein [Actinomycetospora sp. NBRC 106375]
MTDGSGGEVTRWLAGHARPLAAPDELVEQTADEDSPVPDERPHDGVGGWVRAASGARVVALGPAVVGTRELPRLAHRVLDGLVADGGVHTLALQASESGASLVDDHVRGGTGSPGAALEALGSWSWNTREVLDVVRDLAGEPGHGTLRVVGVDPRRPATAVQVVGRFLRTAAPDVLPSVRDALADLTLGHGDQATRRAVDRVRERLGQDVPALIAATSARQHDEAVRHAGYLARAAELAAAPPGEADAVAGRLMADAVVEALDAGGPDERVVLWAHADHVVVRDGSGGDAPTLGAHLRERFGDRYRALVLSAGEGRTRAVRRRRFTGRARTPSVHRLPAPPVGALEADLLAASVASATPAPDLALDLGALEDAGTPAAVTAWAAATASRRSVGDEVSPAAPATALVPCVPGSELDGFAVVRTVHPCWVR